MLTSINPANNNPIKNYDELTLDEAAKIIFLADE